MVAIKISIIVMSIITVIIGGRIHINGAEFEDERKEKVGLWIMLVAWIISFIPELI